MNLTGYLSIFLCRSTHIDIVSYHIKLVLNAWCYNSTETCEAKVVHNTFSIQYEPQLFCMTSLKPLHKWHNSRILWILSSSPPFLKLHLGGPSCTWSTSHHLRSSKFILNLCGNQSLSASEKSCSVLLRKKYRQFPEIFRGTNNWKCCKQKSLIN